MRLIFMFSLFVLVSCKNTDKAIYYRYYDTTIKRMDTNGESTFYYMKKGLESGKIWAEYSGINDGFSGYLVFDKNGKVILLSGDGYFQTKDVDTTKFNYKRIGSYERPNDSPNVCRINFSIEAEQRKNKNSMSKVGITYPKS